MPAAFADVHVLADFSTITLARRDPRRQMSGLGSGLGHYGLRARLTLVGCSLTSNDGSARSTGVEACMLKGK
jgi:hypothetical protein